MNKTLPVRVDYNRLADNVIQEVESNFPGVPVIRAKHVAPSLGISADAFTRHCRQCKSLELWKGSYMFFVDDPEHMLLLKNVIKRVLCSGRKLPAHLRG